jgi:peroxiredoxin
MPRRNLYFPRTLENSVSFKLTPRRTSILALALFLQANVSLAQEPAGLRPGAKAPEFTLHDQTGKQQSLQTLAGPNGLLLLFFRSADWCPFCKGQLVDLEGAQKAFAAKGINVAGVSYDSPAILADFSRRRSITYPLLSDKSSALIDKFGIRNPEGTGMEAGIPFPGYYLIDRHGTIQKRFFETAYVNRLTANSLYENLFGESPLPIPAKQIDATPHVTVTTSQSDVDVAPGAIVRLVATITPGPDTHVYAPGAEKQQYHVVTLTISPSDLYVAAATSYPPSESMNFPELKEVVPVFTGPTALSTSVAAVVSKKTIPLFAQVPHLTIKGQLEYQACTSTVCFSPVKVPLEWTLNIRPLDRERVPEAIQHK